MPENDAAATLQPVSPGPVDLDLAAHLPAWLGREFIGVALWQFVAAFLFILLGMFLKRISDHFLERKFIPLLQKTRVNFDHLFFIAASRPLGYLFLLAGVSGAVVFLPLPVEPINIHRFATGLLKLAFAVDVIWFVFRLIDILVQYLAQLSERTESKLDSQMIPLLRNALKTTVGIVSFLWVVQLFGYNVSSLLAGLGIGGLAIALGLQDTLANFFGSIVIFLDRPFAVGDWIKAGEAEGVVEDIGFRSTRIRTFPKTLLVIPNKTLANAAIDNHSRMPKRRVVQTVGVTYETDADRMEAATGRIREIVARDPGVEPEFIAVRFSDFGDSSLNISVIYFTREIGFAEHMETKERINLAIMRALEELGLSIAFPTRTVYFEGKAARAMFNREEPGNPGQQAATARPSHGRGRQPVKPEELRRRNLRPGARKTENAAVEP